MAAEVFINLGMIFLVAIAVSFIMRIFKQPLIIGYLITGIIASLYFSNIIGNETIMVFSKLGVAFLLFTVGIQLNPKSLKNVGGTAFLVGLIQTALTAAAGFAISFYFFNFNLITSIYIAVALTFSSTIIVLKLLSDKDELEKLYGKIVIGVLILQDIIAVGFLMFMSSSISSLHLMHFSIVYGFVSIILLFVFSVYALPGLIKFIAKNHELLFLFSISWCFLIVALFSYLGFSVEIGALLAGVSLSMSPFHVEISSKIKPIRDFFLIIFFIVLGFQLQFANFDTFKTLIKPALILSAFVIVFKFLIIMLSLSALGYAKRVSFLSGSSLIQISEFSLIIISSAISLGHLSPSVLPLITLVALITMTGSTYAINFSNKVYPYLSKPLSIIERKGTLKGREKIKKKPEIILFGYHRTGYSLVEPLKEMKKNYFVVDFDPEVVGRLAQKKIPFLCGDAEDIDFLEELNLKKVKLIISTIPDFSTNLLILKKAKEANKKMIVIVLAYQVNDALKLYEQGADYVLMPHFLGGEFASHLLKKNKISRRKYEAEKNKHIKHLREIANEEGEHYTQDKER